MLSAHGASDGSDVSLIPHDVDAAEISIDVTHFTIVGVWEARQEVIRITTERILSRGEDLALQRLAEARAEFGDDLDQIGRAAIAMAIWFDDVVRGLEAVNGSPQYLEFALSDWNAWVANLQRFGLDDEFAKEQSHLLPLVSETTAEVARRLLAQCDGTDPATSLRPIVKLGVAMAILGIDISGQLERANDLSSRYLPVDVIGACASIRITDVSYPDPLAKGIENPVSVSAVLDSWNGEPRNDLAMRFKRFEPTGDGLALADTSDEVGTWNTTVRPSASPDETDFVLDLDVTLPTEELELLVTGGEFQERVPTRDRVELLVRRQGDTVYGDSIGLGRNRASRSNWPSASPGPISTPRPSSIRSSEVVVSSVRPVASPIRSVNPPSRTPQRPWAGQIVITAEEEHAGETFADSVTINVSDPLIVTVVPAQPTLRLRARPCSSSPRSRSGGDR